MPKSIITDQEIEESLTSNIIGRNYQLANMIKLLVSNELDVGGKTIFLNGLWGSGKSYFIRSLDYLAESGPKKYPEIPPDEIDRFQNRYITVYYNASEDDHLNDPLGAILVRLLKDVHHRQQTFQEKALEKIQNSIAPTAFIKSLTKNAIDFSKKSTIDELIKESVTAGERREAFQKVLNGILPSGKRLLFLIDELDRCRPSFALDLIEAIHFYLSGNQVVFLLAINPRQLANNLDHRYGSRNDSGEYLDKYSDLWFTLQQIDRSSYLQAKFGYILKDCNAQIEKIAEVLELEPRELDHYIDMISLASNYINAPYRGRPQEAAIVRTALRYYIAPLTLGLSIKNHDEYLAIVQGNGREIISKYLRKSPILVETASSLAGNIPATRAQQVADKDLNEGIIKIICDQYEKAYAVKEYSYEKELHSFLNAASLLGDLSFEAGD